MTLRNRELLNLIAVGLLTAIGFTSVYVARESVVSTGSLSYAVFFFGLYLIAHIIARVTVPFADPYLLPMCGLLTAVGVTEIYRLNPSDAFRQGLWIVIALGVFAGTLILLRDDYRKLESYKYLFGLGAIGLLILPAFPVIGQEINGARLWVHVGSLQFQPGELAKILLIVFLAGYLREHREVLRQGAAQGLRAAARYLGRRDARPRRDERPGQRTALLRDLPRHAVRRDGSGELRRRRARALPRRLVRRLPLRRARPGAGDDLAAPVDGPPGVLRQPVRGAPSGAAPGLRELLQLLGALVLLDRERQLRLAPASGTARPPTAGWQPADPVREHRLHLLGAAPRSWA